MHGAKTIGAGVAAANDDDVFARAGNVSGAKAPLYNIVISVVTLAATVLLCQKVHREVDAIEPATGHVQVAGPACTAGEKHGIEVTLQILRRHIDPGVNTGPEHHALGRQQIEPAIEHALFHLEFRNAVAQQPAGAIRLLEHRHAVACAVELRGRRKAGRSGADDRHFLPRARGRRLRNDPAFVERAIDDRQLDRLDGDGIFVDAEHARPFARRGAQQACELGKVVGLMEALDRRPPRIAVNQVIPVRDQVAERAPLVTERDAAVHAARGLPRNVFDRIRLVDVAIVADALLYRAHGRLDAGKFDETGRLAHGRFAELKFRATPLLPGTRSESWPQLRRLSPA